MAKLSFNWKLAQEIIPMFSLQCGESETTVHATIKLLKLQQYRKVCI
jgi:hypothetical protein